MSDCVLLLQLGATNDANGQVDLEVRIRASRCAYLYKHFASRGMRPTVLPSGGTCDGYAFNPTSIPHWEYVVAALVQAGVPRIGVLLPGLPALHTVHEATMCYELPVHATSITLVLASQEPLHSMTCAALEPAFEPLATRVVVTVPLARPLHVSQYVAHESPRTPILCMLLPLP
eukprot:6207939-Pleurochrysis_carterae.AAC.1